MQQQGTPRPTPPVAIEPEPHPVRIVGIDLSFSDVFNLVILFIAAQLAIAAILGICALIVWGMLQQ